MENYDIVIKNCQVLQPDMTISGECSVAIKDSWIRKIVPQRKSRQPERRHRRWMEKGNF